MFWLLIGVVVVMIGFDAVITARRRPGWTASAKRAYQHIRRVAPQSDKAQMGEDAFVKHYLGLCQKARTPARIGVIAGLALAAFAYILVVGAVQGQAPQMREAGWIAVLIVAVPAPVLIKMVGVRQAKRFAQPPAESDASTDAPAAGDGGA